MAWPHGYPQASGKDTQEPTFDGQFNWTPPLDFVLEQRMDSIVNLPVTHDNGFESFDLNNFAASSAPYSFGDYTLPTQNPFLHQDTVDPAVLSQHNWPNSETASTSCSLDGHSSGSEKNASTSSLGTYSMNSSSYSQTQADSFNTSKSNKRRFCERTMEDPGPSVPQIQVVDLGTMLGMEADQNAISVFERWLSEYPSIYPENSEFSGLAALTKLDVGVVKSWFVRRLRAYRMDDSTFETWLLKYPSEYPGEDEFKIWAGLTKLSLDAVRLWFAQKLRCKASPVPLGDDHSASGSQAIGAIATFTTAPTTQQPSILQRAAAWAREEKETKCEATLDRSFLLRDNHKPFQCTLKCGKKFRTRDDWRRHEEVNWPQEGWVCNLPASAVVAGIRMCTQCEIPNPHADHVETHKKAACSDQPFSRGRVGRLFYRKDHFSQHFRNLHKHVPWIDYERSSYFSVESNFPRRCGFCSHRFLNWKDRVEHIGVHFHDEGKDMTQWNDHSEGEDESGNPDDRHDDDDNNRSPDEGSDSDDDDSDNSPPRSAPKKRVQARGSRSGGQSSTTAPGSSNWTLQTGLGPLEPNVQPSTSIEDKDDPYDVSNDDVTIREEGEVFETAREDLKAGDLKNDLSIVVALPTPQDHQLPSLRSLIEQSILPSFPYRQRPRRTLVAGFHSASPNNNVEKSFDTIEIPLSVRASTGSSRTTSEESVDHQASPQLMYSDGDDPTPKSKDDALSDVSFLGKIWDFMFDRQLYRFIVLKHDRMLNMDQSIRRFRILLLWRFTWLIATLSLVILWSIQTANGIRKQELTVLAVPNESLTSIIIPTADSLKAAIRHYEKLGGPANTFISDDGVQLLPSTSAPSFGVNLADDSSIGAAEVTIGTYFSTAITGNSQTKVVYNDGGGKICIRTKTENDWLRVQCLEGANPRTDTPLTILGWLGGPSIYFITADGYLSGIDHVPANDTWKFSPVRSTMRSAHPQSQLSSVTWFNGTSAWLYYQDANNQPREFGVDDYRDIAWRDGSIGPLGLSLTRGINRTSRWWRRDDDHEALEVHFQVNNAALHGRVYMENTWNMADYFNLGTSNTSSLASMAFITSLPVWMEDNAERTFFGNISTIESIPETKRAYWKRETERIALSGSAESDFMQSDLRNWWHDYSQILVMRSSELAMLNGSRHSLDKDIDLLLQQDAVIRELSRCLIFGPGMMDTGNDKFIPDLSHEATTQDVSVQSTVTGSAIPRHPAKSLDSYREKMRTSISVITLLFWILFVVWSQILLATYTRWVLDTASHSLLGRKKLCGFELVATILATVICVSTLLDLDAKNIESRISPGCIFFVVVPVLLAAVDYPRTWRRYVSCLIIVASLTSAVLCSTVLQWVLPRAAWAFPALMFYLSIPRTHNLSWNSKIAQDYNIRETASSSSLTTIRNTGWVLYLLGDPIGFLLSLATRARTRSYIKAITALRQARHNTQIRFILYTHYQLLIDEQKEKADRDQTGDNADDRMLLFGQSLLDTREKNHFFFASSVGCFLSPMCWYFIDLTSRGGFGSIVRLSTHRLKLSVEKLVFGNFSPVQCCFSICCLTFSLLNGTQNVLGNQLPWGAWWLFLVVVISFLFINQIALFGCIKSLTSTMKVGLVVVLICRVITWRVNSRGKHERLKHSADKRTQFEMNSTPGDPDITGRSWRNSDRTEASERSSNAMQSSGGDVGVVSWDIDPVADVGAWAEGTTMANDYPSTLSGMDLSMDPSCDN